MLDPVRPITLDDIRDAQRRIASTILRTPLVKLELGPEFPDIRLKLENLQPINAYKLRGAANAVAKLSDADRRKGVWTISAGNAGQGVAFAARQAGVPCTVVAIETAPKAKLDRMRALGAKLLLVPYEVAWKALDEHAYDGAEGTLVHPFDDYDFIAGHGTMGLEILEDAPDVACVIAAIGGGGLITGVGSAIKALKPGVKIYGAEPETAAPLSESWAAGEPRTFSRWQRSFVDGAGGQSVFPRMWQRMKPVIDGSLVVTLDQTRQAVRLMAEKARVISEGAGALPLAAALTGKAGRGPIVCVVSGGNIDLDVFCEIITARHRGTEAPKRRGVMMTVAPAGAITLLDHGGQPAANRNYFVPFPKEIGALRSGWSTLAAGVVPRTQAQRLMSTALWGLGLLIAGTIINPVLGFVGGTAGALIGWIKGSFSHTVSWVGRDGIARYVCKGSTSRLTKKDVLRFDAATELRTSATRHYRNGIYTGTSYTYSWTDSSGRELMKINGMYRAKTGMPASTDPYLFAVAAESAWTEALLGRIEQEFRVKGSVEFHLTGPDFVRLGNGWIELSIKGKSDRREAKDIAKVELQKGRFTVEMVDAKKGFFSSTGVFGFDYGALSNARVFMLALNRLTGLQLS